MCGDAASYFPGGLFSPTLMHVNGERLEVVGLLNLFQFV